MDQTPKKKSKPIYIIKRVPNTEKMFFTEHLRVMIRAGMSLSEALNTLKEQTTHKYFQEVIGGVLDSVLKGETFSNGLKKYPKVFPPIFISMIAAGETSGTMDKNLEELSIQMKKDYELKSRVKGAMTYPSVILSATLGIGTFMIAYVIPRILSVFKEFEAKLPFATRMLIKITDGVTTYGIFFLIGLAVVVTAILIFARKPTGKKLFHKLFLNLWILGPIAKKINLARFARTMSTLLKTDIPIVDNAIITADILGNVHYKHAALSAAELLKKGTELSAALKEFPRLFPPIFVQMVSVGERSGTTDELLADLAIFYEGQVDEVVKNLTSIIEPVMILILGIMVGGIAFAITAPIYSLSQQI